MPTQARAGVGRDVLEHGQHRDRVECPVPRQRRRCETSDEPERPVITRDRPCVDADSERYPLLQGTEERSVVAADVEDRRTGRDVRRSLAYPPRLEEPVCAFHPRARVVGITFCRARLPSGDAPISLTAYPRHLLCADSGSSTTAGVTTTLSLMPSMLITKLAKTVWTPPAMSRTATIRGRIDACVQRAIPLWPQLTTARRTSAMPGSARAPPAAAPSRGSRPESSSSRRPGRGSRRAGEDLDERREEHELVPHERKHAAHQHRMDVEFDGST